MFFREVLILEQPLTGSFELIKHLNTSCVLNAIKSKGQISRADIARGTGLTPATVSNIASELISLGLIQEKERGESSGGRKPVMLSIYGDACFFGGIHIASNKIEAVVLNVEADILGQAKATLPAGATPEQGMELAVTKMGEAMARSGVRHIAGAGVCVHGLVKSGEGLLVFAPNLGWKNIQIGRILSERLGVPVAVENDVRAMSLAENWCGTAKDEKEFVYLYIGPGIGGSIVFNNEPYKGQGGFAGEFGHNTIEPDGPVCTCGNRGCLQVLASEAAMLARYAAKCRAAGYDDIPTDFDGVMTAAQSGDGMAKGEILRAARYIGIEVVNIINALSPSLIVINGRITALGDEVMAAITGEVFNRCMKFVEDHTRIIFSGLSGKAPVKGAATCIIRQMFESPRKFLTKNETPSG